MLHMPVGGPMTCINTLDKTLDKSTLQTKMGDRSMVDRTCATLDSNGDHLICGGWWDGSVRMFSLGAFATPCVAFAYKHATEVTALALGAHPHLINKKQNGRREPPSNNHHLS